ncbi:hypothetical protein PV325_008094 [Microctonus aethiopoides]|nr:hypothetical protein PV325_008094 [Microctonus aethiopoides]
MGGDLAAYMKKSKGVDREEEKRAWMWRRRCGWDAFVADEENEEKEGGEDERWERKGEWKEEGGGREWEKDDTKRDQRIVGEDGGGAKQREGEGQGWMRKDESNEEESNECENGLRDRRETIENDLTETEEVVKRWDEVRGQPSSGSGQQRNE